MQFRGAIPQRGYRVLAMLDRTVDLFLALNFLQLEGQTFFQELALRHISPAT